jgi:hypothetical protein
VAEGYALALALALEDLLEDSLFAVVLLANSLSATVLVLYSIP